MKKHNSGFTLIETSIVIMIIGLLVAGIIGGTSLVEASKIQQTVRELNDFKTMINTFKFKYDALPGDMNNATDYWSTTNGSGNSKYDDTAFRATSLEGKVAWKQLEEAGIYNYNFTGTYANASLEKSATPISAVNRDVGYVFRWMDDFHSWGREANAILLTFMDGDSLVDQGAMTPEIAGSIDLKMDDGVAFTGNYRSIGSSWTANCTSTKIEPSVAPLTAATDYNFALTTTNCVSMFFFE